MREALPTQLNRLLGCRVWGRAAEAWNASTGGCVTRPHHCAWRAAAAPQGRAGPAAAPPPTQAWPCLLACLPIPPHTHRTPASPTMPMAMPAARPASPQARPDARCAKPSNRVYVPGFTAVRARAWAGVSVGNPGPWPTRTPLHPSAAQRTSRGDDDGNDEAVDAQHTRHDHRHDALHHQLRPHHPHGSDAHARLRCAVGRAHACGRVCV